MYFRSIEERSSIQQKSAMIRHSALLCCIVLSMPTEESYQDDLDLLLDRAEASVASILISLLMPYVATRGLEAVTADGKFTMISAMKKLSTSTKASKLIESLALAITPAVLGSIDLIRENKQLTGAYDIARKSALSAITKATDHYVSKDLDSAKSLKESAAKTARWLVRAAAFDGQEEASKKLHFTKKRWVTRHDSRVRDTHRMLDGQTVKIDSKFISQSGARLMFPGDITAPLSEVLNCRCSVEFL